MTFPATTYQFGLKPATYFIITSFSLSLSLPSSPHTHTHKQIHQVLDTLVYADRELLTAQPTLAQAQVYVHFRSNVKVRPKVKKRERYVTLHITHVACHQVQVLLYTC